MSSRAMQFGTKIVITVGPSGAGGEAVLVITIDNEKGEELLAGGPNAGGPEPPQRGTP